MSEPHYFSNGTEGRMWQSAWCDRCLRDAPFQNMNIGTGCPILAKALTGAWVDEWIQNDGYVTDPVRRITCIEFKPYGYRDPKPEVPKPPPPGQALLPFDERVPVEVRA